MAVPDIGGNHGPEVWRHLARCHDSWTHLRFGSDRAVVRAGNQRQTFAGVRIPWASNIVVEIDKSTTRAHDWIRVSVVLRPVGRLLPIQWHGAAGIPAKEITHRKIMVARDVNRIFGGIPLRALT